MREYTPLFPGESERTGKFRRILIRKTLLHARRNPHLSEEELVALIEQEALQVCDQCVETSCEDPSSRLIGQYFLKGSSGERKDHVGRFFLHKLTPHLKNGPIRQSVYPILARSVVNLLGQDVFQKFQNEIGELIKKSQKQGILYNDLMETSAAHRLMEQLISRYWNEMQKSPAFQDQLLNQIDDALVKYQSRHPQRDFDIVQFVHNVFQDFTEALKAHA